MHKEKQDTVHWRVGHTWSTSASRGVAWPRTVVLKEDVAEEAEGAVEHFLRRGELQQTQVEAVH